MTGYSFSDFPLDFSLNIHYVSISVRGKLASDQPDHDQQHPQQVSIPVRGKLARD